MQEMLHALEKVNIISTPTDDKREKNSTTVEDLEMHFQTPKLQCTTFSGKNVDKFEFKNFLIQFPNYACSIKSKRTKTVLLKRFLIGYGSKIIFRLTLKDKKFDIALELIKEFLNIYF